MTTVDEPARRATTHPARETSDARGRVWPRFRVLFGIGCIGIALLPLVVVPMLRVAPPPLPPGVGPFPVPVLVLLSLVNPTSFLAVTVWVGLRCAPRVGLVSFIDDYVQNGAPVWPRIRPHLPIAVASGFALAAATLLADSALAPALGRVWAGAGKQAASGLMPGSLSAITVGVTYGGIDEELMLRWGVLSGFAWLWWRARGRHPGGLGPAPLFAVNVAAALLFGLGHLPAVAHLVPLTPALILRTVGLNAGAGLVFGWLFYKRGLETAMVAHAAAHIGLGVLALLMRV